MKYSRPVTYLLLYFLSFLPGCEMNDLKVETGEVTDILPTTARITGYILSAGDGIKRYGHCYGKTPDPQISGTKTEFILTIGSGRYTSFLQNLEPGTQYYVKSYISRDNITEYGAEINFTTVSADKPVLITTNRTIDGTGPGAFSSILNFYSCLIASTGFRSAALFAGR